LDAINRKSFHSPIIHYDVEMTLSDDIVTDLTSFYEMLKHCSLFKKNCIEAFFSQKECESVRYWLYLQF